MISLLIPSPSFKNRLIYATLVAIRVFLLYLTIKLFSVTGGPSSTAIYSTIDTLLKLVSAPISLSALGYGVIILTRFKSKNQASAIIRYLFSTSYLATYLPILLSIFGALSWNFYAASENFSFLTLFYVSAIIFVVPSALVLGIRINSRLQSEGNIILLALCQTLSILCSLAIIYSQINRPYPSFILPLLAIGLHPIVFILFVYFKKKEIVAPVFVLWGISLALIPKLLINFISKDRKLPRSEALSAKRLWFGKHVSDGLIHSMSVTAGNTFPFLSRFIVGIAWSQFSLGIFDAALALASMPFALIYTVISSPMMLRLSTLSANWQSHVSSSVTKTGNPDKLFLAAERYTLIILSISFLFYTFALLLPGVPLRILFSSQYLSAADIVPYACLSQMLTIRHIPYLFSLLAISNPLKLLRYESKLYFFQIVLFLLFALTFKKTNLSFNAIGYALIPGSAFFYIYNTICMPAQCNYYGRGAQSGWLQKRMPISFYPELLIALFSAMILVSHFRDSLALQVTL